jgi:hypothetical protein
MTAMEGCVCIAKDKMEKELPIFLRQLQPNIGYMDLYREIVREVSRKKQGDSKKVQSVVSWRN